MIAHRPFAEPLESLAITHLLGLVEAPLDRSPGRRP